MKTDRLRAVDLLRLARGDLLAIWVPGFYPAAETPQLAKRFLDSNCFAGYTAGLNTSEVLKIGISWYECNTPEKVEAYFSNANRWSEKLHQIAGPHQLPVDLALANINSVWPHGCKLWEMQPGRTCFAGLVRGFADGGEARPHTDRADWDFPCPATQSLLAQIAWNTYLQKGGGGKLQLWDFRPSQSEYDDLRLYINGKPDYSLDRTKLPPPEAVIDPEPSDLVAFRADKVHAVTGSTGDVRIAESWFTGFFGPELPLATFS